jgi:hypothetical protein
MRAAEHLSEHGRFDGFANTVSGDSLKNLFR